MLKVFYMVSIDSDVIVVRVNADWGICDSTIDLGVNCGLLQISLYFNLLFNHTTFLIVSRGVPYMMDQF